MELEPMPELVKQKVIDKIQKNIFLFGLKSPKSKLEKLQFSNAITLERSLREVGLVFI
jgi:hypothetical protein